MKQYVIWKGIASVEIPDSFQAATIGEKRKIFGNYRKLPDFVLLDRQHGIRISCVDTDRIENLKKMDIEQTANLCHIFIKEQFPGIDVMVYTKGQMMMKYVPYCIRIIF